MLFKWTTELAFIRAKFLAKCILERAAYSAEKHYNTVCSDCGVIDGFFFFWGRDGVSSPSSPRACRAGTGG